MTPAEQVYWDRVNRRIADLSPVLIRALLKAFQTIRASLDESELAAMISSGQLDRLLSSVLAKAKLDAAFQPMRDKMRQALVTGVRYFAKDIPKKPDIAFAFNFLDPNVITAVRRLESRVITGLQSDIREVVRAHVENGLRDGKGVSAIAKDIRSLVGLSPLQEETVGNFRTLLETSDREALSRQLRDKRYDPTLKRLLGSEGDGLSASQVDTMTDAYRRKMVARNAETIASTASADTMKLSQQLSVDSAVQQGIYNPDTLMRKWIGVGDDRERPSHLAMNNEVVPYDQPYTNGDNYAGEGDPWNCRCVDMFGYFAA